MTPWIVGTMHYTVIFKNGANDNTKTDINQNDIATAMAIRWSVVWYWCFQRSTNLIGAMQTVGDINQGTVCFWTYYTYKERLDGIVSRTSHLYYARLCYIRHIR